jgi:hypothetical protein
MPIKFRCIHCGQYLGISRSKAGTVVDCPTCGRSMGVPLKDGQAERVGRPSLNHEDSQLAEALREVAAIAHSSERAIPQLPPHFDRDSDVRETREVHMPPPKVIPAEPLPPAERLDPPSQPMSHTSIPSGGGEADFAADTAEETLFSQVPLEHLASLARMEQAEAGDSPSSAGYGQFQWTNVVPWKLWLAFVAVGFVALITGFMLGRWDRQIRPANPSAEPNAESGSSAAAVPNAAQPMDVYSQLGQVAAKGKVEFSQGQGSAIQPDAGAWIYAFPVENEAGIKIPPEWFTSEPSKIVSVLQALGGNAAQADGHGEFQLLLLQPGKYLIVVCSQNKTSHSGSIQPPEPLKQYFKDPAPFLADRAFQQKLLDFPAEAGDLALETF